MKMKLLYINNLFCCLLLCFLISCVVRVVSNDDITVKKYEKVDYINVSLHERYSKISVSEHTIHLPQNHVLDTFYTMDGIRMSDMFVYCYHKSDSVTNDTIVYKKHRQTDGKPFLIVKIITQK